MMQSRRRSRVPLGTLTAAAMLLCAQPALLQAAEPSCPMRPVSTEHRVAWASPLDRVVSVRLTEVTVREALDRLARLAKIGLTYSNELLPEEGRLCLTFDQVPLGSALELLLSGSRLRPVALGDAQVVLAPMQDRAPSIEPLTAARQASVLDRVVVTGSPDGVAERGAPFAVDVVDGATLSRHGVTTLGAALELRVPGIWTGAGAATGYGGLRGASSFNVTAPKVYLDGIEVANPLLAMQLDPARVARVEIIRGPQGAALYGTDAIGGVVNIFSRYDGSDMGRPQLRLSMSAGVSATPFTVRPVFVQDHALSLRAGTPSRSVGLGLSIGTSGAYAPDGSGQRILADAAGRLVRSRLMLTGTARFSLQSAPSDSSLVDSSDGSRQYATAIGTRTGESARIQVNGQRLAQYTLGGSASFMSSQHWTHSLIAGFDGLRAQGLSPVDIAASSVGHLAGILANSAIVGDRGTLRLRSVGQFDLARRTQLTLTLGAEQSVARDVASSKHPAVGGAGDGLTRMGRGGVASLADSADVWYDSRGISAQGTLAWRDQWIASAGLRAEQITGATPAGQHALLPMVGVAYTKHRAGAMLKLRGAFGRGIRPVRSSLLSGAAISVVHPRVVSRLQPESQQGTEFGGDLQFRSGIGLHLTRFDQRATGLVQRVATVRRVIGAEGQVHRQVSYHLENVGAISNRGWEFEGTAQVQRLSLAAGLSLVDSRVARVAEGYRGELHAGDRMFDVPASTLTFSAAYLIGPLTFATSAARAADWVETDPQRAGVMSGVGAANQVSSSADFPYTTFSSTLGRPLPTSRNAALTPITRWGASMTYRLHKGLSVVTAGENLLNAQRSVGGGVMPAGRTVTIGLRTVF